jgi:hypothetical protein
VKDPPPVPYVDVTKLQQYYEILENINIESFRDVGSILSKIVAKIDILKNSAQFKKLGMNLDNLFDAFSNEIGGTGSIASTTNTGTTRENTSRNTNAIAENVNIGTILKIVSKIIESISTSNAATPIGTILFTDAVAKNFAQVNTCNLKQYADRPSSSNSLNPMSITDPDTRQSIRPANNHSDAKSNAPQNSQIQNSSKGVQPEPGNARTDTQSRGEANEQLRPVLQERDPTRQASQGQGTGQANQGQRTGQSAKSLRGGGYHEEYNNHTQEPAEPKTSPKSSNSYPSNYIRIGHSSTTPKNNNATRKTVSNRNK